MLHHIGIALARLSSEMEQQQGLLMLDRRRSLGSYPISAEPQPRLLLDADVWKTICVCVHASYIIWKYMLTTNGEHVSRTVAYADKQKQTQIWGWHC